MGLKETLRNKFIEIAAAAIDKEVDGREITKKLEEQLDKQLGEGTSENLQRGVITNLLLEMVEGLWSEDAVGLKQKATSWIISLDQKGTRTP